MNGVYRCTKCGRRTPVDDLDVEAGECLRCRGMPKPTAGRSCWVCGKAISGYANRKTCSTRCRVELHRRARRGESVRPGCVEAD
jgi:predicted nucleic acid-binding Zn ribbon protein